MLDVIGCVQDILIEKAVAPLVLKTGDLAGAIDHLKRSVARTAQERLPYPKEFLAKHFGKSSRWLYLHLEAPKKESESGPLSDVHIVMHALIELGPEPCSADVILERVHRSRSSMKLSHLQTLLEFYESLSLIVSSRDDTGQTLYAVNGRNQVFSDDGTKPKRMERLERTTAALPMLAASYVRGDQGAKFGVAQLKVSEAAWLRCIADIDVYVRKRIHEAVGETIEHDPDDLALKSYRVALLAGSDNVPQP